MASETALHIALAEMYFQGVATRRVKSVLESLCGFQISAMEVSRVAKDLDTVLDAWRERPLGVTPFVQLDALWCKVRHGGLVQDAAVLALVFKRMANEQSLELQLHLENMKSTGVPSWNGCFKEV